MSFVSAELKQSQVFRALSCLSSKKCEADFFNKWILKNKKVQCTDYYI